MHPRKKIRSKVVELLKAGVDVNNRVYALRPNALFRTEYPCVMVYIPGDTVRAVDSSGTIYDRTLTLHVDLIHLSRENVDDIIDDMSWQVYNALLIDDSAWDDVIDRIRLTDEQTYNDDADNDQFLAITRMVFQIWYDVEIASTLNTEEFLNFGKEIEGQVGDGAKIEINQTIRSS